MKLNKRNHPTNVTYICKDCTFVFTIHSSIRHNKLLYCPYCSDSIAVELYQPAPKKVEQRRVWTAEEVALIDGILEGKLTKYQVAAKTGRTYGGVQKKCEKRAKEKAHEKA